MMQFVPGSRRLLAAIVFTFSLPLAAPLSAQCALDWQPGPIASGPHGLVTSVARLPNGDVLAGGYFRFADAADAHCIARWDGTQWNALGTGITGGLERVYAVAVAGNGDVFVGGNFTTAGGVPASRIARWDGASWHALGSGCSNDVQTLLVLANGDLIAGGLFLQAGGVPANRVARWNGTSWSAVGSGPTGTTYSLAERSNGDLIAGGTFGGGSAVMRWDGTAWTSIIDGNFGMALAVLQNGDVVVGGSGLLGSPGGGLVRWNGTSAVFFPPPIIGPVRALATAPNGDLIAGGTATAGLGPSIARWDGVAWTAFGPSAPSYVQAITTDANSNAIIATNGGSGVRQTGAVRRWNGTSFVALGTAVVPPLVTAFARAPNGELYAGGTFEQLGGVVCNNLARWNGAGWSAFGGGVDGPVTALTFASDGALLVGGSFQNAGGAPANHVARWNGFTWTTLGAGVAFAPVSLAQTAAGEVLATNGQDNVLQRFYGGAWSPLQMPASTGTAGNMLTLPSGEVAIAGFFGGVWRYQSGVFSSLGYPGTTISLALAPNGDLVVGGGGYIQRWDGSSWSMLAQGLFTPAALAYLPNGDLIAAGPLYFQSVQIGVWRFDGTAWDIVDGGITLGAPKVVAAAESGDLFVGGDNLLAGGLMSIGLAHAAPPCRAAVLPFGAGCTGAAGPVALHADTLPWAGGTFASTASGLPATSLGVHAIGDVAAPQPLPLGAPGCSLLLAPFAIDLVLPVAGTAHAAFALPRNASLAGLVFRTQLVVVELDATGNLVQLTGSNALALTIGAL